MGSKKLKDYGQVEPKIGEKVEVVSATPFFDTNGQKLESKQRSGSVTVFEVKEINNQIFYRVGGQNNWIPKSATSYAQKSQNKIHQPIQPAMNQTDHDYNVTLKAGLGIQHGSTIPDEKAIRHLFKDGKNLPVETKFIWVKAPDTNQNKYTNAKLKIIFPDGSIKTRTVHYKILPNSKSQSVNLPNEKVTNSIKNTIPKDLNFSFVKKYSILTAYSSSVDEALRLYQQAYYPQMANTIRQGLELLTGQLLNINQINPGEGWRRSNLNNKLGYIAFLKILPQRIMDVCFALKNYGNFGSHHNFANFTQASALVVLQKYHDLLAYMTNTYCDSNISYADVLITDDTHRHQLWYERPKYINYIPYSQYLNQRNQSKRQNIPQTTAETETEIEIKPKKERMGPFMKVIISVFAIIGLLILVGIGYEVYQNFNSTTTHNVSKKPSLKQQVANLSAKQLVALSIVYADLKLDDQWSGAYSQLPNNGYEIDRYKDYQFGDVKVSAKGNSYLYILEQGVGFGFEGNGSQVMVTFFDPDQNDNNQKVSDYQMFEQVKQDGYLKRVNALAKRISLTDTE